MSSPPAAARASARADAADAPARRPDVLRRVLRRRRRLLTFAAVAVLLAEMAGAMVTTAVEQTPTIDEPVYAGASVVYLRDHSLRLNPEHPPLGKLIIGTGTVFAHARLDRAGTGTQEEIGRRLLYESGNDASRLMLLARLPVIVLTLLFGLVVFAFARDIAGPAAGVAALALFAFSPDLIAHGSLATLDVPAAGFVVTSAWLLWRARRRPLPYVPLAGAALGAALATKMSTLAAVPVLIPLALLSVLRSPVANRAGPAADGASASGSGSGSEGEGEGKGEDATPKGGDDGGAGGGDGGGRARRTLRPLVVALAAAVGMTAIAVAVVWAAYLAVDPRLRWTPPAHLPVAGGVSRLAVDLLPLPRPYRDGMRIQFGFEHARWGGFLFGRRYVGSLWYYLPAAVLVKTPLGMLGLWAAGASAMVALRRARAAAPYVLLPAAVLLAAAMTGSRDLGVRYTIFLPMFLAIAAACAVAIPRRWAPVATAVLLGAVAVSSLRCFPYYLPYSNEAFGGPSKTYLRLHDSNVDWGQDLGRLGERLRRRYPGEKVWLVYKGSGVPASYGIRSADPYSVPPEQVRGLLVVSDSSIDKAGPRLRRLLAGARRIDDVGHSISIFRRPAG